MLDKLKKLCYDYPKVLTGEPTKTEIAENERWRNEFNSKMAKAHLNPDPYYNVVDMLKENGYIIDPHVHITNNDTNFIQIYDIPKETADYFLTLTVPDDQVLLIIRGDKTNPGHEFCVSIDMDVSFDACTFETITYNSNTKMFRHLLIGNFNKPMVFKDNGVIVKSTVQLKWRLLHPLDVDIKKEFIKFSGYIDICVHKDAQDKFPWWNGKYVGGQNG